MPTKTRLAVGAVALVGSGLLIGSAVTGGGATAADGSSAGSAGSSSTPTPTTGGPHEHTAVTGSELATVKAAVKAHDSTITVTTVRKDPDGSYDVDGTRAGQAITLDVSKDLETFTERTASPGGPGGHGAHGGPGGGSQDTAVTGTELTQVTDAVEAHDATITVESVRKDPDGSYDVFGTQDGQPVALDVSKDLTTFTERTGGPGGADGHRGPGAPGGPGGRGGSGDGDSSTAPSSGSSATPSSYRVA